MHRHPTLLKLLTLLLLTSLLLPLAACNPKSASVSFMVFGDPAEFAAYQTLVDAFQAEHPEIAIELIHIPSQSDYRKRLAADLAAGTPADVVLINYRRYAQFAAQGTLEPLGPYLAQSELIAESDFYPQSIEPFTWNGQLMCIPQNLSSLVVYYNKNLFDAAGLSYPADDWTWTDFRQTAQALTLDLDGDGLIDQFGLGMEPSLIRLAPFLWQAGAELVDDPVYPTSLTLEFPRGPARGPFLRRSLRRRSLRAECRGRSRRGERGPLHQRHAWPCSSTPAAACPPIVRSAASSGMSPPCRRTPSAPASCTPTPTACPPPAK